MRKEKEKYVLENVKMFTERKLKEGKTFSPYLLKELIAQWEFDFEMDNKLGHKSKFNALGFERVEDELQFLLTGIEDGLIASNSRHYNDIKTAYEVVRGLNSYKDRTKSDEVEY